MRAERNVTAPTDGTVSLKGPVADAANEWLLVMHVTGVGVAELALFTGHRQDRALRLDVGLGKAAADDGVAIDLKGDAVRLIRGALDDWDHILGAVLGAVVALERGCRPD